MFSIHLLQDNYILIGARGNRMIFSGNELGCFEHKGHLFILKGKKNDSTLFKRTREKRYNIFSKSKTGYDKKLDMWVFDVDAIQDDTHSNWCYIYKDGKFIFESFHTMCDDIIQ